MLFDGFTTLLVASCGGAGDKQPSSNIANEVNNSASVINELAKDSNEIANFINVI